MNTTTAANYADISVTGPPRWGLRLAMAQDAQDRQCDFVIEGDVSLQEVCVVLSGLLRHVIENGIATETALINVTEVEQ